MVYGEEAAQAIYDDKVGKFVIVEAREDNTTRVFIRDMNMFGDARRKEGWWNTFSICNAPVEKGFYMGRIDKVKYDKDGYPIFVIYIVRCVPDDILQHTELCYVFARSLLFLDTFTNPDSDYNHDALFQLAQTFSPDREYFATLTKAYAAQTLMEDRIVAAMRTPTSYALKCKAVNEFFANPANATQYPLLFAKREKSSEKYRMRWSEDGQYLFLDDILLNAERLVKNGTLSPRAKGESDYDFAERYFRFDEVRKAQNKAAKTAAKKAKKQAAKQA
jgi:hypothetical protein